MHFTTARRTVALITAPVLLATLTACDPQLIPGTAAPARNTTGSAAAPPQTVPPPNWKGTTQFLQIKSSGTVDGEEYLVVRQARKNTVDKTVQTVSLDHEPWIKATISTAAVNVLGPGISGDAGQLTAALAERKAGEITKGFDVTFDKDGQVSKVTWLYVSARERVKKAIEGWAGSTQYLQIWSAREQAGVTYLRVRPAKKEYRGEIFETVNIPGPWTEVTMSAVADNVPMDGTPGDADALRSMLDKRTTSEIIEGFDITFAGNGQVSKVTWLYGSIGGQ